MRKLYILFLVLFVVSMVSCASNSHSVKDDSIRVFWVHKEIFYLFVSVPLEPESTLFQRAYDKALPEAKRIVRGSGYNFFVMNNHDSELNTAGHKIDGANPDDVIFQWWMLSPDRISEFSAAGYRILDVQH